MFKSYQLFVNENYCGVVRGYDLEVVKGEEYHGSVRGYIDVESVYIYDNDGCVLYGLEGCEDVSVKGLDVFITRIN